MVVSSCGWLTTRSGNISSAHATPVSGTSADEDGMAENVLPVAYPSNGIDSGELILLCADSLVAEGALLDLYDSLHCLLVSTGSSSS